MKNKMKTTNLNKLNNLLTLNRYRFSILSTKELKRVKGGDGEDNGGGNIIIIPKIN